MKFFLIRVSTLAMFLSPYFVASQSLIVNRWSVAGRLNREEAFPIGNFQEYEFLKDNKYRIYEGGIITVNGNYEMAKDEKSYTLGSGTTSLKVKIIKLTALEMQIVYDIDIAINDTIVYYMSGTPAASIAKKKYAYSEEYFKNWLSLKNFYKKRSDIAIEIVNTIKPRIADSDSAAAAIKNYLIKAELLLLDGLNVPKMQIIQYAFLQDNLLAEMSKLMQLAENNSNINSTPNFISIKNKFSDIEKEIVKARARFNISFKAYYGM
jgi:hypothetical protein